MLAIYPVEKKEDMWHANLQSINDIWFAQPARWMVKGMSKKNPDTYLYHFAHQSMDKPDWGSSHAAEITFVFGDRDPKKQTPSYKKLSNAMMTYWTQFAKTSNPNADGLPRWPRYREDTDINILLDAEISTETNYLKKNLDAIDRVYKKIGKYN